MSQAIDHLTQAQQRTMSQRPAVRGFPHLAEILRQAGVTKNIWFLPSTQSLYLTQHRSVMTQGTPLATGMLDVPPFDQAALIRALRKDQAGQGSFPEFLMATWEAGVIRYEVDFLRRRVAYYGCLGEEYVEEYPAVEILEP